MVSSNSKYCLAIDAGNSGIKVVLNEKFYLSFPNINVYEDKQVNYKFGKFKTTSKSFGKNLLDVTVTPHFNKGGEASHFLYGQMAEGVPSRKENRGDTDKSTDQRLLSNMIVSLAYTVINYQLQHKKAGDKFSKEMTIRADVSTGLPYTEWNQGKDDVFRDRLVGNHRITFHNPFFNELGIENVELIIERAMINVEGDGALDAIAKYSNDPIHFMEPAALLDKVMVIVDIGAFTTEIIGAQFKQDNEDEDEELEVALIPDENYSIGIARGIGHAMLDVIENVHSNCSELEDRLVRRDIEKAFTTAGGFREGKYGWVAGKEVSGQPLNVADYMEKTAVSLGEEIATRFYSFYDRSGVKNNIARIYLCGGGSKFGSLVDKFKGVLKDHGYKTENLITLSDPDPVYANALGYYLKLQEELEYEREREEE